MTIEKGEQTLKEKTAKGLLWGGLSNVINQFLGLVFGVSMGRLLDTHDYGKIAMIVIFSAIATNLQESGFVTALINRKNDKYEDYNSVFWFNIGCSLFLYTVLFLCAPLISDFYNVPELTTLSRVFFLGFVIASFGIVPKAIMLKQLKVRQSAIVLISSQTVSGIVGVTLALCGFSYWGLAAQTMTYITVAVVLNWYFSKWRPSFSFTLKPIKEMFGFSSRVLVTLIFSNINNHIFSMILGKKYSDVEAGEYSQANKWNTMGMSIISGMIDGVAQPILTTISDDKARQLNAFRKMLRFTAFLSFPSMLGLSLISEEFIIIALTDKWIASAEILKILCIWGAFSPISFLISRLIISRGNSKVFMYNTVVTGILQTIIALTTYRYGIIVMVSVYSAVNILWLFVWIECMKRELPIKTFDVIKDISPYALLSVALCVVAHYIANYIQFDFVSLLFKISFVFTLYVSCLWFAKSAILLESIEFLTKKIRRCIR